MINRLQFLRLVSAMTFTSITSPLNSILPSKTNEQCDKPPMQSIYHQPPPDVDYATNPSIFGQILRGELPCITYDESTDLLAFRDRSPRAKLHALIIPKRYIPTVDSLSSDDVDLLKEMHQMGLSLIAKYQPEAYAVDDYITCFHVPPFVSVDHLHLHVLAPASEMNWLYRMKYWCGMRWCVEDDVVIGRLEEGLHPVPYDC